MSSDKRFDRLSGVVESQTSAYDIQVKVISPKDPQKVELDHHYDIKVMDVKTGELKKADTFTLLQGQSFTLLEDLIGMIRVSAANDFQ